MAACPIRILESNPWVTVSIQMEVEVLRTLHTGIIDNHSSDTLRLILVGRGELQQCHVLGNKVIRSCMERFKLTCSQTLYIKY